MPRMRLCLFITLLAVCSSVNCDAGTSRLPAYDRSYLYGLTSVSDLPESEAGIKQKIPFELRLRYGLYAQHGFTVQKSPSLYFYNDLFGTWPQFISVRFTLVDASSMQPLAEIPLQLPAYPGLQRIQLGDYGIELKSEIQYQWYISEIWNSDLPIPEEIAGKMIKIAEGNIVRIDSKYLKSYGGPCDRDHVRRLRDVRIWYDAFACVNELIEASPDDITLRDLRDELLGKCRGPYDRMPPLGCFLRRIN